MAAPPLNAPASQVSPNSVGDLCEVFSARFIGASGAYMIVAPVPIEDSLESPFTLVAMIFTLTKSPFVSEKGDAVSTDNGTVH